MRISYTVNIEFFIETNDERLDEQQTSIEEIAQDIADAIGDELGNITHDAAEIEVCCPHLSI